MYNKQIVCTIIILFTVGFISIFSCKGKNCKHDKIAYITSEDTTIIAKISYPQKWTKKDRIIIWTTPPLNDDFYPDSVINKSKLWIEPILMNAFLDSGYVNIEYIGRNDSIVILNRKYRASDTYTKAVDLSNLLDYINTVKMLKNKKIILVGYSEGGDINSVIGSKKSDIAAMLQLASSALSGKELVTYQRDPKNLFEVMLRFTCHGHQENMDRGVNRVSSLDSYHTADMNGVIQFFKENIEPVENNIYQFENRDSIYFYMDLYLRERWAKENNETKELITNFETYYNTFAGNITPQQITIRTFNPEKYYPFILCPVLAVQGTEDRRIDCYPNIERMEQLLTKGGNLNFVKMILEGYNHDLVKWDGKGAYIIEDSVIHEIVKWVDKQ